MQKKKRIGSWLLASFLLVVLLVGWLNRLAIYDWFRLYHYQPSAQVTQLATDDSLTDYAKHMLYINHPQVEDKSSFNQDCPNDGGEQTIILGCYHGNQTGIFLYIVTDPKLNGVEQVTAAHETLHAAYERLSAKDKAYVNGLLEDFYMHNLKDKRVLSTIESYKKSEPNDVVNEMHSVFGSEVVTLTPALETYYQKYFSNRAQVAAFATAYQKNFVDNQAQADTFLQQIKAIENQVNSLKSQIDSKEAQLTSDGRDIEFARNNVTAFNVNDFNNKVRQYNAEVQVYRNMISQYNSLIEQHNTLVNKYQALNTETNQLIQELDSRSATVSAQ
jgi:predicted  nucleic acid-binding Zn-ribbon protein